MNLSITKVSNGFTVGYHEDSRNQYELSNYVTSVFTSEASLFKFLSKQFAQTEA